jgi:hypothetical protein
MAAAPPPPAYDVLEHRGVDFVTTSVVEDARKKPGAIVLEARVTVSYWSRHLFQSILIECNESVPGVCVALPNRPNILVNVPTMNRDPREPLKFT